MFCVGGPFDRHCACVEAAYSRSLDRTNFCHSPNSVRRRRVPTSNMKLFCLSIIAVCLVSSLEASPGPVFDNKPVIKYAFQSLNKFFSLFTEKENFVSTQHRQRYSRVTSWLFLLSLLNSVCRHAQGFHCSTIVCGVNNIIIYAESGKISLTYITLDFTIEHRIFS